MGLALRSTFPGPHVDVSCLSLCVCLAALLAQGTKTGEDFTEPLTRVGFSARAHAVVLERGDEDRNDGTERQGKEEKESILRSCTQHMLLIPLNWSQGFKNKLQKR